MKLQRKTGLRASAFGVLAVTGALVLTACGSDDNSSTTDNGSKKPNASAKVDCGDAKGQLLASGSSAQKNAMDLWIKNYTPACPDVQVNYKKSSSGEGIIAFNQGTVGFAGSDSPLKPEEVAASKKICKGGQGTNLPMVGGPIAIGYNLSDVKDLVLDASTIAKIFDGKIKKWDDPAIAKLNKGKDLPGKAIQPFHRSDESGTSQNVGKYLAGAAKADWKYEPEKKWPTPGQSASGSDGVAQQVKTVDGAIGYFELSFASAQQIPTAQIATGASTPAAATSENASKAIAAAKLKDPSGQDLALDLDYTTKAEGAYPIVLVTYEIACNTGNKAETLPAVKSFLGYTASKDGQALLADAGYAPIPAEINSKVQAAVKGLK